VRWALQQSTPTILMCVPRATPICLSTRKQLLLSGGAVDATGPSLVDGTLGPLFDGFCSGKWILHC